MRVGGLDGVTVDDSDGVAVGGRVVGGTVGGCVGGVVGGTVGGVVGGWVGGCFCRVRLVTVTVSYADLGWARTELPRSASPAHSWPGSDETGWSGRVSEVTAQVDPSRIGSASADVQVSPALIGPQ